MVDGDTRRGREERRGDMGERWEGYEALVRVMQRGMDTMPRVVTGEASECVK
jgi:hypothetical protein